MSIRFAENLPQGELSIDYYKKLHFHLFQDVYEWAGHYRTVRISKSGNMFCYPEHIENEMNKVFNTLNHSKLEQNKNLFVQSITHFLSDLNAIHPFREGNGRTQMTFVFIIASSLNMSFDYEKLNPDSFLSAMIHSFHGKEDKLTEELSLIFK